MPKINNEGYVCRLKGSKRAWFLIVPGSTIGVISLGEVYFPKEMIGKRVKFKLEFI